MRRLRILEGAGALGVVHAAPALAAVPVARAIFPTIRRAEAAGKVGLSFDDGPEPAAVDTFLPTLDSYGVKATFFVVGEQIDAHPGTATMISGAGHEIACHGYRHRNHLRVSPGATIQDLLQARQTIEAETGAQLKLFRPPYGVFNSASWVTSQKLGWKRVLWARWARDWEARATPQSIRARVLKGVRPGDILLLHDAERYSAPGSWRRTHAALGPIIEDLRSRGLEPVTVGELLGLSAN